jgi:hypothetical protein
MTTTTLEGRRSSGSAIGIAAVAFVVAALLQLALGIPLAPLQANEPVLWPIAGLNALNHVLLIVGVIGLAQSGVAGRGWLAITGVGLTLLGLAALTIAEVIWALAGESSAELFYILGSVASMVGLVLAGIAVLRTGLWTGWRRYIVLATGLYIPLIMFPSFALPGYASNYAIGIWGICWLLLGVALWSESGSTS